MGVEFWGIRECVFCASIYNTQTFAGVMPKAQLSFSVFSVDYKAEGFSQAHV